MATHWIRGFMAFQLARGTWAAVLMVSVLPESGFRGRWRPAAAIAERIALELYERGIPRRMTWYGRCRSDGNAL